jgi:beta-lactamase class A
VKTVLLALGLGCGAAAGASEPPRWAQALSERLERIDRGFDGEIGVYVQDLRSGDALSFRGEESWYLASGVKVPVAIAVMRGVDRGELRLDTPVLLQESDYVDGPGATRLHPPGTELSLDYLLRQMLVRSDNTATDALIRSIGLARVNAVAQELVAMPDGAITTLADVRRRTYGGMHPNALRLSGHDLVALKQVRSDEDRLQLLVRLLGVPETDFLLHDFDSAFDAYYATRLNAATLRDYARMLRALASGDALRPESTRYLMRLLAEVETGTRRLRAGLPPTVRFAHKTGTQRRRVCDFGVVELPPTRPLPRVVVAACTRGEASLARSERALRQIGAAIADSGLLAAAAAAKEKS